MDIASSVSQLHELCSEVVRWTGNYPEVTLGSWIISGVFIIRSIYYLGRRVVMGKEEEEAVKTVEVIKPLLTPYIPGETIVKLVKLLNSQNAGWTATNIAYEHHCRQTIRPYRPTQLGYGKTLFQCDYSGEISVQHVDVDIDLKKFSGSPEMDQILLRVAYLDRFRIEKSKQDNARVNKSAEAERLANKELAHILDTI